MELRSPQYPMTRGSELSKSVPEQAPTRSTARVWASLMIVLTRFPLTAGRQDGYLVDRWSTECVQCGVALEAAGRVIPASLIHR
jgi:hypothetical protein